MSHTDESDTDQSDLGPIPEPKIEPGEPNPGGIDAVATGDGHDDHPEDPAPVLRDLDPDANPAVDDVLPAEVKEGEDTSTQATEKSGDPDGTDDASDADKEAPA